MNRRQFIQNSTLAAAAIGSSSSLLPSAQGGEFTGTIKKAVKYSMVKEPKLSHLDKFKMLKDVGFDGTELRGTDAPRLKEFSKAIEVSGLPVHGVVNGGNPDIAGAIEFSKALGGNTVLVVAVYDKKKPYMESWKGTQDIIRKALPVAEKHQVKILVENVWAGFLISPLDVVRYVDEIDSPWFGSYFDVGNNVRWGVPNIGSSSSINASAANSTSKSGMKNYTKAKACAPDFQKSSAKAPSTGPMCAQPSKTSTSKAGPLPKFAAATATAWQTSLNAWTKSWICRPSLAMKKVFIIAVLLGIATGNAFPADTYSDDLVSFNYPNNFTIQKDSGTKGFYHVDNQGQRGLIQILSGDYSEYSNKNIQPIIVEMVNAYLKDDNTGVKYSLLSGPELITLKEANRAKGYKTLILSTLKSTNVKSKFLNYYFVINGKLVQFMFQLKGGESDPKPNEQDYLSIINSFQIR